MGGVLMDFPVVITRVNDLYPLRISDLGSVNRKGLSQTRVVLTFVADRELVPAFCATATQHFSAVLCGHAGPKAVGIFPLSLVGLKGSLHLGLHDPRLVLAE